VTTPVNLAVVATHPIQYQIPWFCELAARSEVRLKVLYAHLPEPRQQGAGFDRPFQWDIPMLQGYAWEKLPNARSDPDLSRFFGSSTPARCGPAHRVERAAPAPGAVGGDPQRHTARRAR
jgi:hypothetical protein